MATLFSPRQQANIWIGVEALLSNKIRSLLTALGVVFGVAAVIAMLAIGNGAQQELLEQMKLVGVNNIIIKPAEAKVDENKDWISFQLNGGYIIYRKNYEDDINLPRLRRKNGLLYIEDVPLFVSLGMDGIPRFKIFLSDIDIDRPYHKSDVIKNYKEIVYKIRNEDKPKNPEPIIKQEPQKQEPQKQEPQKIKRWWDFLKKQR